MLRLTMPTLLVLGLALATALAAMNVSNGGARAGYSVVGTTRIA